MRQEITGVESLNEFLKPLLTGEYVVSAIETSPNHFVVEWEIRKKYIAHDGTEHLDEAWLTEAGELIQIQDLAEAHAKNIIRMIIRNRRKSEEAIRMFAEMILEHEDDNMSLAKEKKTYLH